MNKIRFQKILLRARLRLPAIGVVGSTPASGAKQGDVLEEVACTVIAMEPTEAKSGNGFRLVSLISRANRAGSDSALSSRSSKSKKAGLLGAAAGAVAGTVSGGSMEGSIGKGGRPIRTAQSRQCNESGARKRSQAEQVRAPLRRFRSLNANSQLNGTLMLSSTRSRLRTLFITLAATTLIHQPLSAQIGGRLRGAVDRTSGVSTGAQAPAANQ
jgi:hypothetical protein